jgi:hypothetical protein
MPSRRFGTVKPLQEARARVLSIFRLAMPGLRRCGWCRQLLAIDSRLEATSRVLICMARIAQVEMEAKEATIESCEEAFPDVGALRVNLSPCAGAMPRSRPCALS